MDQHRVEHPGLCHWNVLPEVLRPTAVQLVVLVDLGRRVDAGGQRLGGLIIESALEGLLGGFDHEYHMKAQHPATLDIDKIDVLHRNTSPRPASELMPAGALAYLRAFRLLRQAEHVLGDSPAGAHSCAMPSGLGSVAVGPAGQGSLYLQASHHEQGRILPR